ncbi:hypothetical protein PR048_031236 [Dryococelus australis]|uniref:Uncharacterized protein n=1 Tax=Dryococelus australis TaxID=614101 RepID=A0ABQ9G8S1_9NEOP|nr:hypothetical protein PR048_031236 [Dryococelus australis]
MPVYTRQKAKSKYRDRLRLERASLKPSSDTHKTPYDRAKRCRELAYIHYCKNTGSVGVCVRTHHRPIGPYHTGHYPVLYRVHYRPVINQWRAELILTQSNSSAYWSPSCVFIGCCSTPGSYGIRKVFPCKSAIDSEACRAGLINCDPIVKEWRPDKWGFYFAAGSENHFLPSNGFLFHFFKPLFSLQKSALKYTGRVFSRRKTILRAVPGSAISFQAEATGCSCSRRYLNGSSAYWSPSCVFIGCCPTPGSYGIRKVFPCKSAIDSEACRAVPLVPAVRREQCTPVQSHALSGDAALNARGSVVLKVLTPLGLKLGKKNVQRRRSDKGDIATLVKRAIVITCKVGRCPWPGSFLGDIPPPPPLNSVAAPYSPHFTLIGSQDLDNGAIVLKIVSVNCRGRCHALLKYEWVFVGRGGVGENGKGGGVKRSFCHRVCEWITRLKFTSLIIDIAIFTEPMDPPPPTDISIRVGSERARCLSGRATAATTEILHAKARGSDEALGVRVSVARIAPSLLDLGRAAPTNS